MVKRIQHPVEVHGVQELLDYGIKVHEMSLREMFAEMLLTLKKIEIHNQTITDNEFSEGDIEDDN